MINVISRKMNNFIKNIHPKSLIIYKKNNKYYCIDYNVYVLKGALKFNYMKVNARKIIFIDKEYVNFVLKKLRELDINYVMININYGYDKIASYQANYNLYDKYYNYGKLLINREKKIKRLLEKLKEKNVIQILKQIEGVIYEFD